MTRVRVLLLLVLCAGGALRYADAARARLEFVEAYEFIPASKTISWDHLPLRMAQHGALPSYLILASTAVFGDTTLGARMLPLVASVATILLLYLIAARWWGATAGLMAAGLLAIERYHISITRAFDLPFDLFFVTLALYCFSRFLHAAAADGGSASTGRWLYGTAAACGLGFLCKEFTALMLPVLFVGLIATGRAAWLKRRQPWFAVAVFLLVASPDLYSNLTVTTEQRMDLRARQEQALRDRGIPRLDEGAEESGLYMSYGDQLSRFKGLGFNQEPFYFYFGDVFDALQFEHANEFDEFPYMRWWMGALLWLGVGVTLIRGRRDRLTVFLAVMFVLMFVPFALVELGPAHTKMPTDAKALWYWVDRTMLPAILMTGRVLADLVRRRFPVP